MTSDDTKLHIATIGKCVGLRGDLKLHLHTDFPEQFASGKSFLTEDGSSLTIHTYDPRQSLVRFSGYEDRTLAAKLTNRKLYTTLARTREECPLEEGQYYWFEIVGARVTEGDRRIGEVAEIERIADTDYLIVRTDAALVKEGYAKRFYIPYIPQYIVEVTPETKTIQVQDALALLEAS